MPCNEVDDEYSLHDHVVIEKEEARRYKEAEGLSIPTGVLPGADDAEKDANDEGKGDEQACEEEEEEEEVRHPTGELSDDEYKKKSLKNTMTLRTVKLEKKMRKKKTSTMHTLMPSSTKMNPLSQMICLPVLKCQLTWKFMVTLMESQPSR